MATVPIDDYLSEEEEEGEEYDYMYDPEITLL